MSEQPDRRAFLKASALSAPLVWQRWCRPMQSRSRRPRLRPALPRQRSLAVTPHAYTFLSHPRRHS